MRSINKISEKNPITIKVANCDTMASFVSLSDDKEFKKLDGRRGAALSILVTLKESIEALSEETPSLRVFNRLDAEVNAEIGALREASRAVAAWFTKSGGKILVDTDYKAYRVEAAKVINEVELVREAYHDLLDKKGLLKPELPVVAPVEQRELITALKTLAESSGQHAAATLQQANAAAKQADAAAEQPKAILQHHRTPQMELPIFNPATCRGNPLAWVSFWQKFENFAVDCINDRARLGFLMSAVMGNALQLIRNFKCVDENYAEAKKVLEEQYNKSLAVREQLLLSCIRFKIPKIGQDFSGFVSSIINLNVFMGELKLHHNADILAENSGCQLV